MRFAIKKHLFQRFSNWASVQGRKIIPETNDFLYDKKNFFLADQKKIEKEYLKKYYPKNVPTADEKKKIYLKLKNFLGIPKIIRRYAIYRYFVSQDRIFYPTSNYYWKTLQQ